MKKLLFLLLLPVFSFGQFNPILLNSGLPLARQKTNPTNTDIIAYYNLDSNTSDQTGLSPIGVATGIDYVTGKTGTCARFDANTDRIDISDTDNTSFTAGGGVDMPFSVSMWVYFTGFNSTANFLINKRDASPTVRIGEWQIIYLGSRLLFTKFGSTDIVHQTIQTDTNPFSLNAWYFITCTDDGSKTNAGMKIYINSFLKKVDAFNAGSYIGMINSDKKTVIGTINISQGVNETATHQGYIEDVSIWKNKVLSQSEINYLYNANRANIYPF